MGVKKSFMKKMVPQLSVKKGINQVARKEETEEEWRGILSRGEYTGTRQESVKEHNLGEDGIWGLIMDELVGLTGKIKDAIIRSLDSEYGLFLEILFTTLSNIHSYFSNGLQGHIFCSSLELKSVESSAFFCSQFQYNVIEKNFTKNILNLTGFRLNYLPL